MLVSLLAGREFYKAYAVCEKAFNQGVSPPSLLASKRIGENLGSNFVGSVCILTGSALVSFPGCYSWDLECHPKTVC